MCSGGVHGWGTLGEICFAGARQFERRLWGASYLRVELVKVGILFWRRSKKNDKMGHSVFSFLLLYGAFLGSRAALLHALSGCCRMVPTGLAATASLDMCQPKSHGQ